jgi:hypothetical protein
LEGDRATLQAIVDAMGENVMTFLRGHDMGNTFDRERMEGVNVVVLDRRYPEHEFGDAELEVLRKNLVQSGQTFLEIIATYTFPWKNGSKGWV